MPSITFRDIPPELHERLKQSVDANRRSLNSEIITCIERSVRGRKIDPEATIERARQVRRLTRGHPITQSDFSAAKRKDL